ncbi:substrate-binding domain-containing protein [uncultured Parvibaculum sp.]|uniref:substrate-binding domain-containing protein n=1 Tax=uncultured Parvibaculum sp. TaxID=291828 RepID=UPI0030D90C3C
MKLKSLTMAATVAVAALSVAGVAHARDQISIVGSSTVFPFTQAAAEQYANETGGAAPVVESTGTGGGMKIFCGGVGTAHADITGASRAMKKSEYDDCQANGVTDITEVLIGYDGIAMAVSRKGKAIDLTKAQLFQALAAKVEVNGKIVDNPYKKWSDIDSSLPNVEITVMGPPPTSGTRDAWVELVMEEGCEEFAAIEALDKDAKKETCQRMRTDGPFVEAGENDNLIVQRLESDPNAYGIFGYSFLFENTDKLQAVTVAGVGPSIETIADGSYKVSRPIFFYIKNAHRGVIPGLNEFIAEYVSDDALAPGGYLSERGLIPLSDDVREKTQKNAIDGVNMAAKS